jgi:hypothetical protein
METASSLSYIQKRNTDSCHFHASICNFFKEQFSNILPVQFTFPCHPSSFLDKNVVSVFPLSLDPEYLIFLVVPMITQYKRCTCYVTEFCYFN